jgi:hypothetical protein
VTDTASGTAADLGEGESWPGLSFLSEEIAALSALIGEITGGGRRDVVLRERLVARLGELRAAIDFTVTRNALDWEAVNRRRDRQRAHYESLHAGGAAVPGA